MTINSQIEYYNKAWADFEFANNLQLSRCIAILAALQSLGLRQPRICDLGSGPGWLTNILRMFGPTVGVELSDVAVAQAKERFPASTFLCADIRSWNYPKSSFDIVVSQEVIEHFEDQGQYVGIASDLLESGGHLILTTPNARTVRSMPESLRSDQPLENILTTHQLRNLLSRGFESVKIDSIILGHGTKGVYALANLGALQALLKPLGLAKAWRNIACRLGYGLHLVAVARKRE